MRLKYSKYSVTGGLQRLKTKTALLISGVSMSLAGLVVALAVPLGASAAVSNNYQLFGDATLVSGGHPGTAVQATTTGSQGYGGVTFNDISGLTVSQLNTLSTDYNFTTGTCGSGSPRFSVGVTNGTTTGYLFFYVGPAPDYTNCPTNAWTNSGNLAAPTNEVDATQLGGSYYEPYSQVQAAYGSYTVTDVSLVLDGSSQTVLFDNTQLNGSTYTYEPAPTKDSCKNNGWRTMTNPGPFKNQGDCVSFFATNGKNLPSVKH